MTFTRCRRCYLFLQQPHQTHISHLTSWYDAQSTTFLCLHSNIQQLSPRSKVQVHVHLPVSSAAWWVLLQHCIMLPIFFIVECGIARLLCAVPVFNVWASSSSQGYLYGKFCFFCGLHCWASQWRKSRTHSITHQAYMPRELQRFCYRITTKRHYMKQVNEIYKRGQCQQINASIN